MEGHSTRGATTLLNAALGRAFGSFKALFRIIFATHAHQKVCSHSLSQRAYLMSLLIGNCGYQG